MARRAFSRRLRVVRFGGCARPGIGRLPPAAFRIASFHAFRWDIISLD